MLLLEKNNNFPELCFPVLTEIVEEDDTIDRSKIDGQAKFKYKIPKDVAAGKIKEFEQLVTGILNDAVKPGYTDFEKALALYMYFPRNYKYDYDAARKLENHEDVNYLSSYRLLTTGTGICGEISAAYSYLLMQLDVDASVVKNTDHEWSIIDLYGKYYHIDATAVLNDWDNMAYFMMTDEQRGATGFPKEQFMYSDYHPEEEPDFSANDETFKELWNYRVDSFDTKTGTLSYYIEKEDETRQTGEFKYRGY